MITVNMTRTYLSRKIFINGVNDLKELDCVEVIVEKKIRQRGCTQRDAGLDLP